MRVPGRTPAAPPIGTTAGGEQSTLPGGRSGLQGQPVREPPFTTPPDHAIAVEEWGHERFDLSSPGGAGGAPTFGTFGVMLTVSPQTRLRVTEIRWFVRSLAAALLATFNVVIGTNQSRTAYTGFPLVGASDFRLLELLGHVPGPATVGVALQNHMEGNYPRPGGNTFDNTFSFDVVIRGWLYQEIEP